MQFMNYILAIAEEGSLVKASRRLGISQPTLSEFLYKLEDQLGTQLFIRTGRDMELTESGRIYYNAARRAAQIYDQTLRSIENLHSVKREPVRFTGTPYRGAEMFANIYAEFNQRYPDKELQLIESYTGNIKELIEKGEADVGLIALDHNTKQSFQYLTVTREELVVAVPSYLCRFWNIQSAEDSLPIIDLHTVEDIPFVLMAAGTTTRAFTDALLRQTGIVPTVVYESENSLLVRNMIGRGNGVGFVPRKLIGPSENITYFSLEPSAVLDIGLIMRSDKPITEELLYLAYLVNRYEKKGRFYVEPVGDTLYERMKRKFAGEIG